jgi:anti-sigma regulatory factor (Ser/Thr protein kinase)
MSRRRNNDARMNLRDGGAAGKRAPICVHSRPRARRWAGSSGEVVWYPAALGSLAPVRRALAEALEKNGFAPSETARVLVCFTEAIANAVEHGSRDQGRVGVSFVVTGERAFVRVVDEGPAGARMVTPAGGPVPTTSTCGRGVLMMRALADAFVLRPHGRGTEVVMRFVRDGAPREAPHADGTASDFVACRRSRRVCPRPVRPMNGSSPVWHRVAVPGRQSAAALNTWAESFGHANRTSHA